MPDEKKPEYFIYQLADGQMETNFEFYFVVVDGKVWGLLPTYPTDVNGKKALVFKAIQEFSGEFKEDLVKEVKKYKDEDLGIIYRGER
ncbi:MAG: hypothetical protein ACTSPI_02770 [Candidatus Heimdallarchaeaceae archaeon]